MPDKRKALTSMKLSSVKRLEIMKVFFLSTYSSETITKCKELLRNVLEPKIEEETQEENCCR